MAVMINLLCTFFIVFVLTLPKNASALDDFYIQQALEHYFSLPEDARSISMGGSEALSCHDSACIFLNPAGLGRLPDVEFSLTLGNKNKSGNEFLSGQGIEQIEHEGYGVLTIPLGITDGKSPKLGTVALAYSRYQGHTDDSIRTSPDGHRRSIAYGLAPLDTFIIGYMFTFYDDQLRSQLADLHSTSRFLHVFGIQLRPFDDLIIGTVFKFGIGKSDTEDFIFQSDGLSRLTQYTAAFNIAKHFSRVAFALGFDYTSLDSEGDLRQFSPPVVIGSDEYGHTYNFRIGTQVELSRHFLARTGFRYQDARYQFSRPDLKMLSGSLHDPRWSGGLGYVRRRDCSAQFDFRLDYGFEYSTMGQGDWRHLITLAITL